MPSALRGRWSCNQAGLGPHEPSLADKPVEEVVREEPAPAEPFARHLPFRCHDGRAHGGDDELLDPGLAAHRLGVRVVIAEELTRVRVTPVRELNPQAAADDRTAALE